MPERQGLGSRTTAVEYLGKTIEVDLDLPDHYTCDSLEQLGECDSMIVDPHKLGYVPYPAGVVAFKSNLVRPLLRQSAPYIEESPLGPEGERVSENIGVYILEGSKPGAAAASVWLSHTTIPLDASGHGELVKQTIRNACELATLLREWPSIGDAGPFKVEVLCPPESNIVCYAFRPAEGVVSLNEINEINRKIYRAYSLPPERRVHVYDQNFFLSRTVLSADQYSLSAVRPFLERLGVSQSEFEEEGVFLLRSTLMNPWYELAKEQGRPYIAKLVRELYESAASFV